MVPEIQRLQISVPNPGTVMFAIRQTHFMAALPAPT
jgi:hypothetical protein